MLSLWRAVTDGTTCRGARSDEVTKNERCRLLAQRVDWCFAGIGRLFRLDDDFDCGVGPENLAVTGMMLSVPMSDTPLDLVEKI
jgi:hypothetical protein